MKSVRELIESALIELRKDGAEASDYERICQIHTEVSGMVEVERRKEEGAIAAQFKEAQERAKRLGVKLPRIGRPKGSRNKKQNNEKPEMAHAG